MNANAHLNFYLEEDCITEFENTFRKSMDTCLSDQLTDILKGRRIIFDSIEQTTVPVRRDGSIDRPCTVTPRVIHPSEKVTFISAIDSSVIHLARTEEGRLYACKIWNRDIIWEKNPTPFQVRSHAHLSHRGILAKL